MYVRRIELHTDEEHLKTKIDKDVSCKTIIELFIKSLKEIGFSNDEINSALGSRKEIKDLRVEIGKLKSYIDELEYDIRTKYRK